MTLAELTMVMQDNFNVVIYGNDPDTEISRFDNGSYIDEKYEECEVTDVYPNGEHEICICIDDSM